MGILNRLGGKYKASVRRRVREGIDKLLYIREIKRRNYGRMPSKFVAKNYVAHEHDGDGPFALCGKYVGDGPKHDFGYPHGFSPDGKVTCNMCQRERNRLERKGVLAPA